MDNYLPATGNSVFEDDDIVPAVRAGTYRGLLQCLVGALNEQPGLSRDVALTVALRRAEHALNTGERQ